jgi:hypothetical protein
MKKFLALLAFCSFAFTAHHAAAQCSGGTNAGSITPAVAFNTIPCITGGQYYTFAATAGVVYEFTFCAGGGSCSFDGQLTILNNAGAYAGGYSDDVCGAAPALTWTAPSTGTFRVLFNNYFCTTGGTCATLAYRTFVPPAGSVCSNPIIIPALPYTVTGGTTCGFGDDYDSGDACLSSYMNGDDIVYRYTSPGNERITITLTGTSTWVGVFLLNGCPDAGGTICMPLASGTGCGGGSATNTSSAGNPFGSWDITAPGVYYIVISTFPSPQCTPFNMSVTTAPIPGGGGPGLGCYTISTPPYSPYAYNSGTAVVFPDDEHSAAIPIGFTFCFMGTNYNDFVISSNAYITFNTACAGTYSPWDTDPFPSPPGDEETYNGIHFPWHDIDPDVTGTIRYNTYGTAPNRVTVVSFRNVAMFSLACNSLIYTGQVALYETTNIIETYIASKPVCGTWNGGEAVHGLLDATGTVAVVVPGRNNTSFTLTDDAVRFTPTCAPCMTTLPVHYANFSGQTVGSVNHLQWITAYEKDQSSFVLERSRDGNNFEVVGEKTAAGNSTHEVTYNMEDANPFYPETFYRLREVDVNGQVTYSHVISLNQQLPGVSLESVYADDQSDRIFIRLENALADEVILSIIDTYGREVFSTTRTITPGMNALELEVPNLAQGVYHLRALVPGSHSDVKSFVNF